MVATAAPSKAPIVVAIDFHDPSVYALRRGAEIFRRSPSFELELLHVIAGAGEMTEPVLDVVDTALDVSKRMEDFVRTKLGDPSALAGRRVGIHVRTGTVAEEIVKLADDVGAQLIVVGSHGRKGLMKKILGSTSEKVLELAHCSVVIATGDPASEAPAIEPPCPDCQRERVASAGKTWWCSRHAEHHVRGHALSYRREWPFALHDSEVIPTGVDLA
jgi:nucleotide-binding universal stress UspA family protein